LGSVASWGGDGNVVWGWVVDGCGAAIGGFNGDAWFASWEWDGSSAAILGDNVRNVWGAGNWDGDSLSV
jgi:hypothetical protein